MYVTMYSCIFVGYINIYNIFIQAYIQVRRINKRGLYYTTEKLHVLEEEEEEG